MRVRSRVWVLVGPDDTPIHPPPPWVVSEWSVSDSSGSITSLFSVGGDGELSLCPSEEGSTLVHADVELDVGPAKDCQISNVATGPRRPFQWTTKDMIQIVPPFK